MGRSTDISPARTVLAITPAAADLPNGICRYIWAGTAGTATMTDAGGNTLTNFPLVLGLNHIQIKRVTSLGTAANLWALY